MIFAAMTLLYATCMMAQEYLEGDIVYLSSSRYSKTMKSYVAASVNGVDTVTVTIKGNNVHEFHSQTQTHIIYRANDRIITWSDYSKHGLDMPFVAPIPDIYPGMYDVSEKDAILGTPGTIYWNIQNMMGSIMEMETFIADTEIPLHPEAKCALNVSIFGAEYANKISVRQLQRTYYVGNKAKKALEGITWRNIDQRAGLVLNDMWQESSIELLSITPREVSDEEFERSVECNIEYVEEMKTHPNLSSPLIRSLVTSTVKKMLKDYNKQGKKLTNKEVEDAMNIAQYIQDIKLESLALQRENGWLVEPEYDEPTFFDIEKKWAY